MFAYTRAGTSRSRESEASVGASSRAYPGLDVVASIVIVVRCVIIIVTAGIIFQWMAAVRYLLMILRKGHRQGASTSRRFVLLRAVHDCDRLLAGCVRFFSNLDSSAKTSESYKHQHPISPLQRKKYGRATTCCFASQSETHTTAANAKGKPACWARLLQTTAALAFTSFSNLDSSSTLENSAGSPAKHSIISSYEREEVGVELSCFAAVILANGGTAEAKRKTGGGGVCVLPTLANLRGASQALSSPLATLLWR